MKIIGVCILLIGTLSYHAAGQTFSRPDIHVITVSDFNALFNEFDLNASMQRKYAITKEEYTLLMDAWKNLSVSSQTYLLTNDAGWADFARMLLFDLYMETTWEDHIRKAATYGARDISLTVSKYNNVISVKRARETLVDWIRDEPTMLENGHLVVSDLINEELEERMGRKALDRLTRWETLINTYQEASALEKLNVVRDFFAHHINETPDTGEQRGNDYWQSPIETLIRGKGDCDDFAVAHYVSLRLLGISASQLRISLVTHPSYGNHGVVFFFEFDNQDPWVLDNMASDQIGVGLGQIQKLSVRMRMDKIQPLWGFNESFATSFQEGRVEAILDEDPRELLPAFATVMTHSKSLLPADGEFVMQPVATYYESR